MSGLDGPLTIDTNAGVSNASSTMDLGGADLSWASAGSWAMGNSPSVASVGTEFSNAAIGTAHINGTASTGGDSANTHVTANGANVQTIEGAALGNTHPDPDLKGARSYGTLNLGTSTGPSSGDFTGAASSDGETLNFNGSVEATSGGNGWINYESDANRALSATQDTTMTGSGNLSAYTYSPGGSGQSRVDLIQSAHTIDLNSTSDAHNATGSGANDGVEDGAAVWTANAKFELVSHPTLGTVGQVTAGGAWCSDYFHVVPPGSLAPGTAFVATLIPEARLQHANVSSAGSYILVSKYRTEAVGVDVELLPDVDAQFPSSAAVQFDVVRAPHIESATAANLTAYRPMHGADYAPFTRIAVPNAVEDSATLGPGIRFNPAGNADDTRGEDDLIEVTIKREAGQGDLMLQRSSSDLKVYSDRWGITEISFDANNQTAPLGLGPGNDAITVYVEWAGTGTATEADLRVKAPCGPTLDTLKFHKFQGIAVAFAGLTQYTPGVDVNADGDLLDVGDDPKSGTWAAAYKLYQQGYDAYWFDHGQGALARNEADAAVLRGVNQTAIFGYSLGGWETYMLAEYIDTNNIPLTVTWTGYVDAIRLSPIPPFAFAEDRKPIDSLAHTSQYQTVAALKGEPTTQNLGTVKYVYDGVASTNERGIATFPCTYKNHRITVSEPGFEEVYVNYNWKSQRFEAGVLPNETIAYETNGILRISMVPNDEGRRLSGE
ncbi:MAG: hypothetical protein ACT4O2_09395 [Beijerinckiaceae bacterium]